MRKAVLISIRPKWCEKIASGEKTIEVRKIRPKLETPFKCYVYCTQDKHIAFMQNQTSTNLIACMDAETAIPVGGVVGNGKVIGEFVCDKMYKIERDIYPEQGIFFDEIGAFSFPVPMLSDTCLKEEEIGEYMKGCEGYGWHISNLKIYDMPRKLNDFRRACKNDWWCDSCAMHWEHNGTCGNESLQIRRPPQSWCYVEELL